MINYFKTFKKNLPSQNLRMVVCVCIDKYYIHISNTCGIFALFTGDFLN